MNTLLKGLIAIPTIAIALAGCTTTSGGLSSSAERLERAATAFQRDANDDREARRAERDAGDLAAEARDFRETLADRRADDRDISDAFRDLSRSYHAARDEVERRHNRDTDRDFAAVTEAYLDVERAMNTTERRDRYARDD
jgi:hypothetical protein